MEDDKKLTVETETVEAVPSNILPNSGRNGSTTDTPVLRLPSFSENNVELGGERTPDEFMHQSTESPLNAVKESESGVEYPPQQLIAKKTLIDHNPMSPHSTGSVLKNKKSSLLIDESSSVPPMATDSTYSISGSGRNKSNLESVARPIGGVASLTSTPELQHINGIKSKIKIVPSNIDLPTQMPHARQESVTEFHDDSSHVLDKVPLQRQPSGIAGVGSSFISSTNLNSQINPSGTNNGSINNNNINNGNGTTNNNNHNNNNSNSNNNAHNNNGNGNGSTKNNNNNINNNSNNILSNNSHMPLNLQAASSQGPTSGNLPFFQNKMKDRPNMVSMNSREILLLGDGPKKIDKGHMVSDESVHQLDNDTGHRPTKTDFFAARLASAVGENEISDSEETFVYESAANSTKNMIYPSTANLNDVDHHQGSNSNDNGTSGKVHSIATKSSVPVLNGNTKLFSRLKSTTRHISTGGMPNASLTQSSPNVPGTYTQSNLSQLEADRTSLQSSARPPNRHTDQHSIRSLMSEQKSPDRKMGGGLSAVNESNGTVNSPSLHYQNSTNFMPHKNQSRLNNFSQRSVSVSNNGNTAAIARHTSIPGTSQRPKSNMLHKNGSKTNENKKALRTTVSKIFDANGTSLRRYSGVPDNVNLEDFIEQAVDSLPPGTNQRDRKIGNYSRAIPSRQSITVNQNNDSIKSSPIDNVSAYRRSNGTIIDSNESMPDTGNHDRQSARPKVECRHPGSGDNTKPHRSSAIEDTLNPNHRFSQHEDEDDDDDRSMFYYNHGSNLEARPQISEYEGDVGDQDSEEELIDDGLHHQFFGSGNIDGDNISPNNYDRNGYYGAVRNSNIGSYFPYVSTPINTQEEGYANGHGRYQNKDSTEFTPLNRSNYYVDNNYQFSPHNFYSKRNAWTRFRNCFYLTMSVLLLVSLGFILGFLLAANKELREFDIVVMDNVISSTDELIFDLTTTAFNPGIFPIYIDEVEFDIFAKTQYLRCNSYGACSPSFDSSTNVETIFLGIAKHLETPLKYQGGFFNRNFDISETSVRLHKPGSDEAKEDDGEEVAAEDPSDDVTKWKLLIKHDYELILRGNVKYKVPFFNTQRSIAVQMSADVRPGKEK